MEQYRAPKKPFDEDHRPKGENPGFYVKGGPWEHQNNQSQVIPDTSNAEEFPSMLGATGSSESPRVGWGVAGSRVVSKKNQA